MPSTPEQLPPARGPDRRHLENIHTRVNGEDGLHGAIIEPYTAPLLDLAPNLKRREKPITLKFVNSDALRHDSPNTNGGCRRTYKPQPVCNGWQTVKSGNKVMLPVKVPTSNAAPVASSTDSDFMHDVTEEEKDIDFPVLPSKEQKRKVTQATTAATAPSVQSAAKAEISTSREPEEFISHIMNPDIGPDVSQPVISQKKRAKKEREAKRKARKLTVQEHLSDIPPSDDITTVVEEEIDSDIAEGLATSPSMDTDEVHNDPEVKKPTTAYLTPAATSSEGIDTTEVDTVCTAHGEGTTSAVLAVTSHSKHSHWYRFTRNLIVDQLTPPCMISSHTPTNGSLDNAAACAFERQSEPDCPFHDASQILDDATSCTCCAYRKDICHLTYPGVDECSFGPLDRLHCEKLLGMYENDSRTKGRIMLVDDVLHDYVRSNVGQKYGGRITDAMPKALAREYANFFDKCKGAGPLMHQEHMYQRLAAKNRVLKHPISSQLLHKMQLTFEPKEATYTCYCHTKVVRGAKPEDTIVCSHRDCTNLFFHKACVKQRHPENVTRWYCTRCAQEMKALARDVLCASGDYDGDDMKGGMSCQVRDEFIRRMMEMPDAEFEKVKQSMMKVGFRI
ncbi:hypothetical protein NX059_000418 [Plenodomus lindquistii]|nr:hypothetical protein NX059_000418 [Plenodomus lindquistii]